jgi:hypothetical protein
MVPMASLVRSRMTLAPLAVLLLALAALSGCAEGGEFDERGGPAYPQQPVGYTPPPAQPPAPPMPPEQAVEPSLAEPERPADQQQEVAAGEEGPDPEQPSGGLTPDAEYADTDPAALTDFRGALDPYGDWVEDPSYGTVWVPSAGAVGADFTPYVTAGHWTYDNEYVWVSDYPWGWAPFHYGRWAWVDSIGWEWIPGRTYAGAWVAWRYGWGDWPYVGWAPLGPRWCWRGGTAVGLGYGSRAPYAYVGSGELFSPGVGTRVITGPQAGVIEGHTQPYSPGSSTLAGRVVATPSVGGPPPQVLHIPASLVAHGSVADRGVATARAFSRPSTAVRYGARRPQAVTPRTAAASFGRPGALGANPPSYAPQPSHFGGRLGAGFSGGGVANAPGYGRPYYPGTTTRPYYSSAPGVVPRYSAPSAGLPRYSAPAAGYHGAPAASGGTHYAPPAGGGHSSGGYSGGGFRGGGWGGGFHGGGGGGGSHGGGGRR